MRRTSSSCASPWRWPSPLYRAQGWSTPFGLYRGCYGEQIATAAELGLVPLVASYGPALLDRAILDALGRAHGLSFADDDSRATCRASPPRT